ncbi:MAG: hypothetical protein JSV66_18125, partial [Trueperaceae bacterium]
VVDRPGWVAGNALAILISGSGRRVAMSFDGDETAAPQLHVEYALNARPPRIDRFDVPTVPVRAGQPVVMSWSVADPDGGPLGCTLDVGDDGVTEYEFADCQAVPKQLHEHGTVGSSYVRLTVSDEDGNTTSSVAVFVVSASDLDWPSERIHIFYYPWYGNPSFDLERSGTNREGWRHWQQAFGGTSRKPPEDIGSNFYPSLGAYSSSDPSVIDQHMQWISEIGIGVAVVSWWGQGSWEDLLIPAVLDGAQAHGVRVAFHLEPYTGVTTNSLINDIAYIYERYGSHPAFYWVERSTQYGPSTAPRGVFYVFDTLRAGSEAEWRATLDGIRGTDHDAFVVSQQFSSNPIEDGHFDGVYTYGVLDGEGTSWSNFNNRISASGVFSPSVGPGFDETRAVIGSTRQRSREGGLRYDSLWSRAIASGSEWISITSFNEWHEGTQIEPAVPKQILGYEYESYEGAYGLSGENAEHAYLTRTRFWVGEELVK